MFRNQLPYLSIFSAILAVSACGNVDGPGLEGTHAASEASEAPDDSYWGVRLRGCPEELIEQSWAYDHLLGEAEDDNLCYLKFRTDRTFRIIKPHPYGAVSVKMRWAYNLEGQSPPVFERFDFLKPRSALVEQYRLEGANLPAIYNFFLGGHIKRALKRYAALEYNLQEDPAIISDEIPALLLPEREVTYFEHGVFFLTPSICKRIDAPIADCIEGKPWIRLPLEHLPMHPMQPHPDVLDFLRDSQTAISPFAHPATYLEHDDVNYTQKSWFFDRTLLSETIDRVLEQYNQDDSLKIHPLRTSNKSVFHIEVPQSPGLVVRCPTKGNEYVVDNELAVYDFEQTVTQSKTVIANETRINEIHDLPNSLCLYSFFVRGLEPSWNTFRINDGTKLGDYLNFRDIENQMSSNEFAYPVAVLQILTSQDDQSENSLSKNVFWMIDGRTILFDNESMDMSFEALSDSYTKHFYELSDATRAIERTLIDRLKQVDLVDFFESGAAVTGDAETSARGIRKFAETVVSLSDPVPSLQGRVCNITERLHYIAANDGNLPDGNARRSIRLACNDGWQWWDRFDALTQPAE